MEPVRNSISSSTGPIPYTTEITAGSHVIIADEPTAKGGAGKGMGPHDLLLASLVSCTAFTIKMYAQRKEWNLTEVHIDATMEREVVNGKQNTGIVQTLEFKGELTGEMIARLAEIAKKCPVHRLLSNAASIEIKLKQ